MSILEALVEGFREAYRGDSEEHDHELFLSQHRMPHKCIDESRESSSSLLHETSIRSYIITID